MCFFDADVLSRKGVGKFRDPSLKGTTDMASPASGRKFPNQRLVRRDETDEIAEISHVSGERDAVIACRVFDVVNVASDKVRKHLLEPLTVIEKVEVMLSLNVAEVVPIANLWTVFEMLHEVDHLALTRHLLVMAA